MEPWIPMEKQSKKAQREYHKRQRGNWNGVCTVTRTVPNGKAYDRNSIKQKERKYGVE